MKIVAYLISALIASVSCTVFGFGGPFFSAFAGIGKSKGVGGPPIPPYPVPPFPFPFPPVVGPPPQIIKVIHEHINAPGPSKVVKVVHQHQKIAIPALHEHVNIIQDNGAVGYGDGGPSLPYEAIPIGHPDSYGSSLQAESGIQVLDGGNGGHIVD